MNRNLASGIWLCALLQMVAGSAKAQATACRYCPDPINLQQAAVEFGLAGTSGDGLRFALDSAAPTMASDSPLLWLSGSYTERTIEGAGVSLEGSGMGLDDAWLDLAGYRQGRYALALSATSSTYRPGPSGHTFFLTEGTDSPSLPADWLRAGSSGRMNLSAADSNPQAPKWRRRSVDLRGIFDPGRRWHHTAGLRHQEGDGQDWDTVAWLTQVTLVPAAVQWSTDDLNLASQYVTEDWQARLGYTLSRFHNQTAAPIWPNPYTALSTGADQAQLAPAPDNLAQEFSLAAQYYGLPRLSLSGRLAAGRLEQDDQLLSPSVNPLLQPALPRPTARARIDTLRARLSASYRISPSLRLGFKFRHDGHDNRTPPAWFEQIQTDVFAAGERQNRAYSFRDNRLQLRADFRMSRLLRLRVDLEEDQRERLRQARQHTRERRLYADVRLRGLGLAKAGLTTTGLRLGCDRRSGSALEETPPGEPPNSRQLAYNLADRERCSTQLRLSLNPRDSLQIDLQARSSHESYERSLVGLQRARHEGMSASFSSTVREAWQWQAWFDWTRSKLRQSGQQALAGLWWATSRDRMTGVGLSVQRSALLPRLDVKLQLHQTRTDGRVAVANEAFPDLRSRLIGAQLQALYRWRPQLDWIMRYRFERYRDDDWQRDDLAASNLPNLLVGGVRGHNDAAQLVSLSIRYRFP